MLLGTMAVIMALLIPSTRQWGMTELLERQEAAGSDRLWSDRARLRRDWYRQIRLSARRRRRAELQPLPAEPLPLPDDLLEAPLRDVEADYAALATLHRFTADADADADAGYSVCCPAVEERTSPVAGMRRDGSLAMLYADDTFRQMFFERSCRAHTDGEAVAVERHLRRRFHCQQEYSNSYAVFNINGSKVLDYMRIRSGCRCQIKHKTKRKKKKKRNRRKGLEGRRRETKRRQGQTRTAMLDAL